MIFEKRRNFIKQFLAYCATSTLFSGFKPKQISELLNLKADDPAFWNLIRNQFPLAPFPTYFNTGTVGVSPYSVIDAVKRVIDRQETYGEYAGWELARQSIANFIKAKKEEISLTHNTSEGINIVSAGLPLGKNDEVILCSHEHVGNALAWLHQAKIKGFKIRVLNPALTASENLNKINELINKRTKVIALPHITCTTGLVFPAAEISKLAKEKGIWSFFDGAQGVGATVLDIKKLDCDFYASCCHKWMLAPKGTGFLYVKESLLDVLQPIFVGAYSDIGWELTENTQIFKGYAPTAHRYDYSTQSTALWTGVTTAANFLTDIGIERIVKHSSELANYLQIKLLEKENVEMLTPIESQSKSCMIGFRLKNIPFRDFGKKAEDAKFRIRLVPESGLDSIRISTHFYNNYEEIDRFLTLV